MIDVTFIMNSYIEEIYSFKCCGLHGLNLEILIRNRGTDEIEIKNCIELKNQNHSVKCGNLYPPHPIKIKPDEMAAFYTPMDDGAWNQPHPQKTPFNMWWPGKQVARKTLTHKADFVIDDCHKSKFSSLSFILNALHMDACIERCPMKLVLPKNRRFNGRVP